MRLERHSRTRKIGGNIHKYYIQCQEKSDWIQDPFAMDVNQERAIVQAILKDGLRRKNQKIVVKIGTNEMLQKEYKIGEVIKNIPGFIRFICTMKCKDNLRRYRGDKIATICSKNPSDPEMNLLIMPYYEIGSVRKYPWERHPEQFRSALTQLFLSLYIAFIQEGFIHNDIHIDNILLSQTKKETIEYILPNGRHLNVPTHGIRIHIMDFEYAFLPVDRQEVHALLNDYRRIIYDIRFTTNLESPILYALEERLFHTITLDKIEDIIEMINSIDKIEKRQPPKLVYDVKLI